MNSVSETMASIEGLIARYVSRNKGILSGPRLSRSVQLMPAPRRECVHYDNSIHESVMADLAAGLRPAVICRKRSLPMTTVLRWAYPAGYSFRPRYKNIDRLAVVEAVKKGETIKSIAFRFNISEQSVRRWALDAGLKFARGRKPNRRPLVSIAPSSATASNA